MFDWLRRTSATGDVLWNGRAAHGESPVWAARLGLLLAVDTRTARLIAVDPAGLASTWTLPEAAYWIVEHAMAAKFLVGLREQVVELHFDGRTAPAIGTTVYRLPTGTQNVRFNDAKADMNGRLHAGVMDLGGTKPSGALHQLGLDGQGQQVADGYVIPNGPAISPDGSVFYQADSARHIVYAFDVDRAGVLTNRRIHVRCSGADGPPDGMACDVEGGLWVAHWGTGHVSRTRPDGSRDRTLRLPVRGTTSLAFFGRELDRLAVTTSAHVAPRERGAGAIWTLAVGVCGAPVGRFGAPTSGDGSTRGSVATPCG